MTINKINCGGGSVANTGFGACSVHMKTPLGAILVPRGWVATQLEETNLLVTLESKSKLDDKTQRFYPLGTQFEEFEAAGGEFEEQTFGSGRVFPVKEQNNNWTFTFIDGGICLTRSIRSFDASSWSILFHNDKQIIGATSASGRLMGIPLETLKASAPKPQTFSAAPSYTFTVGFKPKYVCEQIALFEIGANETMPVFKGLNTVVVEFVLWVVTGTELRVRLVDACFKSVDYGATYGIAVTAAQWVVKNASGASVTPTTVAFEPATNTYKITTPSNISGGTVTLVAPSVLNPSIPNAEATVLLAN